MSEAPTLYNSKGGMIVRCADCSYLVEDVIHQSNKDGRFQCDKCWNKEQYEWEQARRRGDR